MWVTCINHMRDIMKPPNPPSLSLSLSLSLKKIEFISPNFQEKFKDLLFTKSWQQIPPTPTQSNRIKPKGKCITIIRACKVLIDEHRTNAPKSWDYKIHTPTTNP